jgi:Zn-dependent protease/predicted transcriptional regulator
VFGKRVKLFTLLGFQVNLDASWLILALLIVWTLGAGYFPFSYPGYSTATYWAMAVGGALGLFASIVVHEFAHAVVARRYGIPMKGITLFIFGGVAEMDQEPPSAKSEFRMAAAGPLVSIAVAALLYVVYRILLVGGGPGPVAGVFGYLSMINGILAVFNLIPAFPLDGGRMLRAYLWERRNDLRSATRTASAMGGAFGLVLIVLGVVQVVMGNFIGGMWWFLIGMFVRGASRMSYRQMEIRQALEGEPVSRFMRSDPITVPPEISLYEMVNNYVYRFYHDVYPVVEGSHLVGCVGTRNLKQVPQSEWPIRRVEELVEPCTGGNTVRADTDAVEALAVMSRTGNSRLMVTEGDRLLGVIALKDLLGFLAVKLDLDAGELEHPEARRLAHP